MPGIRVVGVPSEKYYRDRVSVAEIQPLAAAAFRQIVSDLTGAATEEETHPAASATIAAEKENEMITVVGGNYGDAAESVNQLFLENRWADGLPIVPPTAELVKQMLGGTTRSPADVVGQVAPKNGIATIEKIAINAVMAGARPAYLPVIIAAMEGLTDKNYDLTHMQASTGSFAPLIIVNGPIAKELNFNSGIGLLGHGWRANSTCGRAVRMCLLNIGQTWPGVNDMALIGRLESYTFFTFAENEEASPWEPYHAGAGFSATDSTVTVATTANPFVLGGGAVAPWTAQTILDTLLSRVSVVRMPYLGGVYSQTHNIVFTPDCAAELAKMGYTRKSLQEWIYEKSRVPYEQLTQPIAEAVREMIDNGAIRPDRIAIFKDALRSGGRVPVVQGPEDFHIFVAGGAPGYSLLFSYPGPNFANQTKKITGATLTKAGR
jgi:hypothetical protein